MTKLTSTKPAVTADALDRRALKSLVDASWAINGELGLQPVLDLITDQAVAVLNADGASVLLLDEQRGELVFHAATGPSDDVVRGERMPADRGIAGQAVQTKRAVRVDKVEQNRNFFDGIDLKTKVSTRSLLAAPMIHRGRVLGVVEVINPQNRQKFNDGDLELLKVYANLAAVAARNALAFDQITKENQGLRSTLIEPQVIGDSAAIRRVLNLCRRVAVATTSVLLQGETGTGKEMAASMIHFCSPRRDKPFIALNCAAIPETLMESELFGHEKGAFTGATAQKPGRFELANGGTLFLDEIGELPASSQTKLLRVLQEREFTRVGGTQTLTCDVRIIAASNRDLKGGENQFRQDLYYRLSVFPIEMPPLRTRLEDIPALVEHFLEQIAPDLLIDPPAIDDAGMAALKRYHWPGNIRELRNVVERCALMSDKTIRLADLPPEIAAPENNTCDTNESPGGISILADNEQTLIVKALEEVGWNQSAAARSLGITRDHLRYRLKKYAITRR